MVPLGTSPSDMETARRRHKIGTSASAALPTLWKAIARKGWTHEEFADAVGLHPSSAWRLRYGERGPGPKVTRVCFEQLGVKLILWEKPCPPNWRPHEYPDIRRRGEREREERESAAAE
jgi:hypothetical protein